MSLYEDWMKKAFSQEGRSIEAVWEEYLWCIKMFHLFGIDVYADIVLNHLMGADGMEQVIAYKVDAYHRHKV